MLDRLVLAVTGQRDVAGAWRSLVKPADRVGIKVATAGGRYFSSHRGVVGAVVSGLRSAGVPAAQITIWDRSSATLRVAGFVEERGGVRVRGIDPPGGWDPAAKVVAPVLGKLIWGDLLFRGKAPGLTHTAAESDQLSAESHLASVLTRDVTKIINLAVLSDEAGCGVAGALYNVTVPNVDNVRRFTQPSGASSICDLYADARIGPKVVLHVLDGLLAQYAAGPEFNPRYVLPHATLYASKDPVALDATALRLMERWRKEANLPPLGRRAAWLEEAAAIGLGNFAEERIVVQPLPALP